MAAVTIHSDFVAQENQICHCSNFFPFYLPWSDGTRCHDFSFSKITLLFHPRQEAFSFLFTFCPFMVHSLVIARGLAWLNEAMRHTRQGHPRWTGHSEELWHKLQWSTGGGNGNPFQYSCLENPMDSVKRQKDRTLEDETPRLEGVQYATGEGWRVITNTSRKKWSRSAKVEMMLSCGCV